MKKQKLTALCHKISMEKGLPFNSILTYYFLENILEHLAKSPYNEKLVFKGGFLLSNMLGLETRSTVDIDLLIRNTALEENNILKIFTEALKTADNGDISYTVQKISPIKEESEYGGLRVNVLCCLENIKVPVQLDIATGDVITPDSFSYNYKSVFGSQNIGIYAYPLETMIAEKLQTIYSRGFLNTRSKDYYDLYILYKLKKDELNIVTLKEACIRTFDYRDTEFSPKKIIELLDNLKDDNNFLSRWNTYAKKNTYVKGISFIEALSEIKNLLNFIS